MARPLSSMIAPTFHYIHEAVREHRYTHYWLKGGRMSTKSSFAGIQVPLGVMRDPWANAVCIRKVKDTIRESVYEQCLWGIDMLGVTHLWQAHKSTLTLAYLPTGQKIIFRGADNPRKVKSAKLKRGYIKIVWYEELDEFSGPEEIRMINQTFLRGGPCFTVLYTYNPPKSPTSWVNSEAKIPHPDRLIHSSTYLDVPREWLGEIPLLEAEHLKATNERAYRHEYLGEEVGVEGLVFKNVTLRAISQATIHDQLHNLRQGLDFGYAIDPSHYSVCAYDRKRRTLYIFGEVHKAGMSNTAIARQVTTERARLGIEEYARAHNIYADCAEPKSIADLRGHGIGANPVVKGPDSVEHGLRWMSDYVEQIIIDPDRCPNTAREFTRYEYPKDARGEYKAGYSDKDNHSIDSVRYALCDDILDRGDAIM